MDKCVAEIDANLPTLENGQEAYSITVAEASLPYLKNCVKENFRITPVFTMPLARRVMSPEGIIIAGEHIPQGVSLRSVFPQNLNHSQCTIVIHAMTFD
jgi:cytochrome P450